MNSAITAIPGIPADPKLLNSKQHTYRKKTRNLDTTPPSVQQVRLQDLRVEEYKPEQRCSSINNGNTWFSDKITKNTLLLIGLLILGVTLGYILTNLLNKWSCMQELDGNKDQDDLVKILKKCPAKAYEILNLPETASLQEIKKKYRELSFNYYPGKGNIKEWKVFRAAGEVLIKKTNKKTSVMPPVKLRQKSREL